MSRLHYLLALLLVIISVCGISKAYDYGIASVNYYNVTNIIKKWQYNRQNIDLESYQKAKNNSLTANQYHPDNALYVDLLGQVIEWGVIFEFENSTEGLNLAKQYYLQATQLRPLWPVTWASLAKVKWRLQEFDDDMYYYLDQANKLGPKKLEVNILYAELGLALYKNSHPMIIKIRPVFYQHLAQGLINPYSRNTIRQFIKNHEAEKLVCRWLRNEPNATKWLESKCR